MTKVTHKSPVRTAVGKVSALRKQSATSRIPLAAPADNHQVAEIVRDLGEMIQAARQRVAVTANATLTTLYWRVGHHVRTQVLERQRAAYGAKMVAAVGRQLEHRYGRGFGEKALRHMVRFVEAFPNAEIVSALQRQLSWSHFKQLIYIGDELKRNFYAEMCRAEGWSTRIRTTRAKREGERDRRDP